MSSFFLRRPVLACVLNLMIILSGYWGYTHLGVREYPAIESPLITVNMNYKGASPEVIESSITQIAEEALAGVEGLKLITATSKQGQSKLSLEFMPSINPSQAAADVRDLLDRVRSRFPKDMDDYSIAKADLDGSPLLRVAFWSDQLSDTEISDYLNRFVKNRFFTLEGVADVSILGERTPSLLISLDPLKLAARGITLSEIENAIKTQHIQYPAGQIQSKDRDIQLQVNGTLKTPEDFENIIIRQNQLNRVLLKDVAIVRFQAEKARVFARIDGHSALQINLIPQVTADTIAISNAVKKLLPQIEKELPKGLYMRNAFDSTLFVRTALDNLWHTIAETIVLVALVTWLFLRSFKATLIPMLTIPVSLMGTFSILLCLGYSLNLLTLLALVLAVGLVVDDAIVVMESIEQEREKGLNPWQAAIEGLKKVIVPVLTMTLTLIAVYLPLMLIEGRTGKLFAEFAVALSAAVLLSGVTAVTLTPLLCYWMLPNSSHKTGDENTINENSWGEKFTKGFAFSGKAPLFTFGFVALCCWGGYVGLTLLKTELAPSEDRGLVLYSVKAAEGVSPSALLEVNKAIEEKLNDIPEIDYILTIAGMTDPNESRIFIPLKPWDQRTRTEKQIITDLDRITSLTGGQITQMPVAALSQNGFSKPVQYVLQGNLEWSDLHKVAQTIVEKAKSNKGLKGVDLDLKITTPQINIHINRQKTAFLGISVDDIARTLGTYYGTRLVDYYPYKDRQYRIVMKIKGDSLKDAQSLETIYIHSDKGKMIPLSDVVIFENSVVARKLARYDRMRSVTISAGLSENYTLGEAIKWFNDTVTPTLNTGLQANWSGPSQDFLESQSDMNGVFIMALGVIYLLLAALFNRWKGPLVIMLTVPFSLMGGIWILWMAGVTLNVYSQIGLLTLVGLITKHGVLIIDAAEAFRHKTSKIKEISSYEAVSMALKERLRPILMTTVAMVVGAVPLMFASGAGAMARQSIGIVLVGGLSLGTVGVLVLISGLYCLFFRDKKLPSFNTAKNHE
jgi:multidrug efflux pump